MKNCYKILHYLRNMALHEILKTITKKKHGLIQNYGDFKQDSMFLRCF